METILNTEMTIEITKNPTTNQWIPLLQHRGDKYQYPTTTYQFQGPLTESLIKIMNEEPLKNSHLMTINIKELLTLRHYQGSQFEIPLKTQLPTWQLNVDQTQIIHHNKWTPKLTKNPSTDQILQIDKTTINDLFNYQLVFYPKNQNLLALDQNWPRLKDIQTTPSAKLIPKTQPTAKLIPKTQPTANTRIARHSH